MRYIDLDALIASKRKRWGDKENLWEGNALLHKDFRDYFYNKCWYCECELSGSDMPIEHWRPKKAIIPYKEYNYNKAIASTGYDWLKNKPENYRGSCTYSNSKRGNGGKQNFFPLTEKSGYMTVGSEDTSVEKPLLLDPCVKEDVKLLTFVSGSPFCSTSNPEDQKRVAVSIELFNLDDGYIKRSRMRVWNDVIDTIDDYETGNMSKSACIKRLERYTSREYPFSGTAIAAVVSWDNEDIKSKLNLEL